MKRYCFAMQNNDWLKRESTVGKFGKGGGEVRFLGVFQVGF
jgi:hypothetical protein